MTVAFSLLDVKFGEGSKVSSLMPSRISATLRDPIIVAQNERDRVLDLPFRSVVQASFGANKQSLLQLPLEGF